MTYNSAIAACEKGGEWKRALNVLSQMRADGIAPGVKYTDIDYYGARRPPPAESAHVRSLVRASVQRRGRACADGPVSVRAHDVPLHAPAGTRGLRAPSRQAVVRTRALSVAQALRPIVLLHPWWGKVLFGLVDLLVGSMIEV